MANNPIVRAGTPVYPWNPFNDLTTNKIIGEAAHTDVAPGGVIIIPRCAPFFVRDGSFKIKLRDSGRELSRQNGEYSFIYPFGGFIKKYSQLVYSGILIHNATDPANYLLDYSTIGSSFVLDDIAYAQAVANTLSAPRRADWSQLTNLPPDWPADPHDHPASDTFNYEEMTIALQSYIDAFIGGGNPESLESLLADHLKADLQTAHKATLEMLGIKNLKDWAMATQADIAKGNSTEQLINMNVLKETIRQYQQGGWV